MVGKRHKKNLDAKNVAQTVAKSYLPSKQPTSRIPNPPPGFKRIELSTSAKIQHFMTNKFNIPCPGLHKVIEIQGAHETSYYCALCDAPCNVNSIIPHLKGFKHQLSLLEYYDRDLFEEIGHKRKCLIEDTVSKKLRATEKKYGRGLLKVEKDVPDNVTDQIDHKISKHTKVSPPSSLKDYSSKRPSTSSRNQPSSSKQGDFLELYQSCSLPDPSKAGFYCKICTSYSNCEAMWEAHIRGKRHITNLKKGPGTVPSKTRNVPAPPGTTAMLKSLLKGVYEPVVGLDQIREIQRMDIDTVVYTCFLCGGISICDGEIVDHILSKKHREKHLEKIDHPDLETLRACQMSEHALSSVIATICEKVEEEDGRGRPEVYYAKNSL